MSMYKKIKFTSIIVALILLFITLYFGMVHRHYEISGEERNTISIKSSQIVVEEVYASNLRGIKMQTLPVYNGETQMKVKAEVYDKNEQLTDTVFYEMQDCESNKWSWINIESDTIKENSGALIVISLEDAGEGEDVHLLLCEKLNANADNKTIELSINGETYDDAALYSLLYIKGSTIKMLLVYLVVCLSGLAFYLLFKLTRHNYAIALAIFFIIFKWITRDYINNAAWATISDWSLVKWLTSWQWGIYTQSFVGTIVNLIFPSITENVIRGGVICFYIFTILMVSILFYQKQKDDNFQTLCIIFVVSPFFIDRMIEKNTITMIDAFVFGWTCLTMMLASHKKTCLWTIPVTIIGTLAYQQYVFFTIPVLLLYMGILGLQKKERRYGLTFVAVLAINFIIALWTQLNQVADGVDVNLVSEAMRQHTSYPVSDDVIYMTYFATTKEVFMLMESTQMSVAGVYYLAFSILFSMPFLVYIYSIMAISIRHEKNKYIKALYTLMVLTAILPFVTFFIQSDWCRYFASYMSCLALFLICMYKYSQSTIKDAIIQVNATIKERFGPSWLVLLAALYAALTAIAGNKSPMLFSGISQNLLDWLNR